MARGFTRNDATLTVGLGTVGDHLDGVSALSFSAICSADSFQAAANDNRVFSFRNSVGFTFVANVNGLDSTLRIGGRSISTDAFQSTSSTTTFSTGTEYVIGAVLDFANDKIRVYVNGTEEADVTVTFTNSTYSHSTDASLTDVFSYDGANDGWDGYIAEAALWSGDIGAKGFEALSNRYSPLLVSPHLLEMYWPLNDGEVDERDLINGFTAVETTAAVTKEPHPRIIYPTGQILQFPPAAGVALEQATRLGLGGFPRPPMGTAAITPVDSVSGTIGVTLGAFAPSGAGTSTDFITGTVGVTLDTYVPAGTGVSTDNIAGTIVVTMAPFVGAAVGTSLSGVGGSIATTLSSFVGAAAGQLVVTGDITTTMAAFNAVLAGTVTDAPNGSIAAVMDSFVAAAEGSGGVVTLTHFSGADYYHTLFGALPGETTIDAEYRYLIANGASKAAIPDMWVELLTAAGYSGGLNAMWRAWQANGATW